MAEELAVIISRARVGPTSCRVMESELIEQLSAQGGLKLYLVPHLYDLPPASRAWQLLRSIGGSMVVLCWLYPRATFWVLDANGVRGRLGACTGISPELAAEQHRSGASPPDRTIWCLDLRAYRQAKDVVAEIGPLREQVAGSGAASLASAAGGAAGESATAGAIAEEIAEQIGPRWYPVVDYSRCNGCMECMNFCLFGVFGLSPGEGIAVEQPDACRDGCPACARICPAGAIMFPEHDDPAIAGDPNAPRQQGLDDLARQLPVQNPIDLAVMERQHALGPGAERSLATPSATAAGDGAAGSAGEAGETSENTGPGSDAADNLSQPSAPGRSSHGSTTAPEASETPEGPDSDELDRLVDELDRWDMDKPQ